MNNKSKPQSKREEVATGKKSEVKKDAKKKIYNFSDGTKVDGKNYADALKKRNKMIDSAPASKSA